MLYFFIVYQTSDNMACDKQHWCALIPEIQYFLHFLGLHMPPSPMTVGIATQIHFLL